MFLKLGNNYNANILITNINNQHILDDVPYITIHDIVENKFWNGIAWQLNEFQIIMSHIDNGVYGYTYTPDKTGIFDIFMNSTMYSIAKQESLEVYSDSIMKYDWLLNSAFLIKYTGEANNEVVNLTIFREYDETYYDGAAWVNTKTVLTMPLLSGTLYTYSFVPDETGDYDITILSGDTEIFYIIAVSEEAENIPPVLVSNENLKAPDNTDSILQNEQGIALSGVTVSVFNPATKEVIAKKITNSLGEWNMMLKPGQYYFMFEKGGYISVGFERQIN